MMLLPSLVFRVMAISSAEAPNIAASFARTCSYIGLNLSRFWNDGFELKSRRKCSWRSITSRDDGQMFAAFRYTKPGSSGSCWRTRSHRVLSSALDVVAARAAAAKPDQAAGAAPRAGNAFMKLRLELIIVPPLYELTLSRPKALEGLAAPGRPVRRCCSNAWKS